jgi:hypothetical protein
LRMPRVWRAASMRSRMLWIDLSSAPKRKMARHSAFFASHAACPSGSSGEFSARRICRYSDNTTVRFRARSSAVAQISPPPPPFAILHRRHPAGRRAELVRNERFWARHCRRCHWTGALVVIGLLRLGPGLGCGPMTRGRSPNYRHHLCSFETGGKIRTSAPFRLPLPFIPCFASEFRAGWIASTEASGQILIFRRYCSAPQTQPAFWMTAQTNRTFRPNQNRVLLYHGNYVTGKGQQNDGEARRAVHKPAVTGLLASHLGHSAPSAYRQKHGAARAGGARGAKRLPGN